MQVMLSKKRPPHEVRIDHIKEGEGGEVYFLPENTYAYTSKTPLIVQFDKEVNIESFWIRLHRSPKAYIERSEGTRLVQVYLNSNVVAETTFLLTSTEWVLIKPVGSIPIVGDTLYIQEKTDLDSLVVSWNDGIKHY